MEDRSTGMIIGILIGLVIGVCLAFFALFCFRYHRMRSQMGNSSSRRAAAMPMRENVDCSMIMSDSTLGSESPKVQRQVAMPLWLGGFRRTSVVAASGLPEYSYRDLQKATFNFTISIGQGAFGPVYKAQMLTGETVALRFLPPIPSKERRNSNQRCSLHLSVLIYLRTESIFMVMLLGRLHHRNLVNLIGYCAEKGRNILIYVYMNKGSLSSHLYNEKLEPLSWNLRLQIALDIARGLEYLHDGAAPPVIHRDIKSSNILLDESMSARVADFGLSREELVDKHASSIRGTFGYLDPEYVSSRAFTKKSDIYSYGVLLFELIGGRNPQHGLIEYVELAAMNTDGGVGWEEISDPRLDGQFDIKELNEVATLAYKCINRFPRKRPSMRNIVQVLSRIIKSHKPSLLATTEEVSIDINQRETPAPIRNQYNHQRNYSPDSSVDNSEV